MTDITVSAIKGEVLFQPNPASMNISALKGEVLFRGSPIPRLSALKAEVLISYVSEYDGGGGGTGGGGTKPRRVVCVVT